MASLVPTDSEFPRRLHNNRSTTRRLFFCSSSEFMKQPHFFFDELWIFDIHRLAHLISSHTPPSTDNWLEICLRSDSIEIYNRHSFRLRRHQSTTNLPASRTILLTVPLSALQGERFKQFQQRTASNLQTGSQSEKFLRPQPPNRCQLDWILIKAKFRKPTRLRNVLTGLGYLHSAVASHSALLLGIIRITWSQKWAAIKCRR